MWIEYRKTASGTRKLLRISPYRYDCKQIINPQIDKRTAADYYIKGSPFFIDGERNCLLS